MSRLEAGNEPGVAGRGTVRDGLVHSVKYTVSGVRPRPNDVKEGANGPELRPDRVEHNTNTVEGKRP